ncbi:hypothetical protein AAV97_05035 [Acinetobacter sp. Ag2]|uniref:hypothetical protein n=1 Tax=Acinetobacter sp. Ag2 TaxID=1646532 RepID=UPI000629265B|nr:hypothetical protein [Acinetobacter sp. Ag2]KKW80381.1 hypothetical protein AAV97_05035 [Acinetobacter sp. Ag2]
MNICIGGELQGQIVQNDGYKFKVDPNSDKGPYYFRQSIVLEDQYLRFWFSSTVKFEDALKSAEGLARQKVKDTKGA